MRFWGYQVSGSTKGAVIPDIKVDLVAIIMNLCEYPNYLRVVSSQLFYNRVLHNGSW